MAMHIQETKSYYSLPNNKNIKLLFQDTISGEWAFSYFSLYKLANCIILIYDITDNKSFQEIFTFLANINTFCKDFKKVLLLGNKTDKEKEREIPFQEAENYAREYGFPYMEISCAENNNILEAVEKAIEIGLKNSEKKNISQNKGSKPKKKSNSTV